MKAILLIILFFPFLSQAVCNNPISRENVTKRPEPTSYNTDLDKLYDQLNSFFGDCINDNSITDDQFPDLSLGTSQFADASITAAKFAPGVIPAMGKLLRVRVYSATGPNLFTKQSDMGSILVQIVGGGGGTTSNGTYSSFGSHCIAGGGLSSASGSGGTATGGDINLPGGNGENQSLTSTGSTPAVQYWPYRGAGGHSMLSPYGNGGSYMARPFSTNGTPYKGAGSGAYCAKFISRENLNDPETVTIGTGGTGPAQSNPGKSGIAIIYEFGR